MWRGDVRARGISVAYVNCLPLGDVLKIADLRVSHDRRIPPPFPLDWLPCFRRLAPKQNFQRRGIGTALLRETLARAKAKGFREVFGDIAAIDLAAFPGLPRWYEGFGFEVSASGTGPMIRLML